MPQALNFKVNGGPGYPCHRTPVQGLQFRGYFPLATLTHVKVFHVSHVLKVAVEMA